LAVVGLIIKRVCMFHSRVDRSSSYAELIALIYRTAASADTRLALITISSLYPALAVTLLCSQAAEAGRTWIRNVIGAQVTCHRPRTMSSSTISATPPRRARRTATPTWSSRTIAIPVAATAVRHISRTCSRYQRRAVRHRTAGCFSSTRCTLGTPWPRAWTRRATVCAHSRLCSRRAWKIWVRLRSILEILIIDSSSMMNDRLRVSVADSLQLYRLDFSEFAENIPLNIQRTPHVSRRRKLNARGDSWVFCSPIPRLQRQLSRLQAPVPTNPRLCRYRIATAMRGRTARIETAITATAMRW